MGVLVKSARVLWKGIGLHEDIGRTLMFEMKYLVDPVFGRMSLAQRRLEGRLRGSHSLRINLGCGSRRIEGWVNVDGIRNQKADLVHDLRRPLPLRDESAEFVLMEHVLEHFFPDEADRLLRECCRVLEPNGVLRVLVPDAEKLMRAYVERDFALLGTAVPGDWSAAGAINQAFRQNLAHRHMYDFDDLSAALRRAGFLTVVRTGPGVSQALVDGYELRTPQREAESLYVEATKA